MCDAFGEPQDEVAPVQPFRNFDQLAQQWLRRPHRRLGHSSPIRGRCRQS
ncbi:hypothetical protein DMH04_32055 [Kibdelosporangium aridum]|uniref:Uncharacterized protein n=1 Tax=Kibdelosporangium aridum TaxID=2030 RepID=A0A428Z251_KIBAR|nr:hypothetical protein DMH04_32055 [Kibdelosporangium aridum]